MLSYYKTNELILEEKDDVIPNCWIKAIAPTAEEIEGISRLGIPKDFVTYSLDTDERSRIEQEDDGTCLIVVNVPIPNENKKPGKKLDIPYSTIPLGIILADKYIITVCSQNLQVLDNFSSGKIPKLSTTKRYRFTLHLLMAVTTLYLDDVRALNSTVESIEDQLMDSMSNNELIKLFSCNQSFVYFKQALKQNELTLLKLPRIEGFKKFEEDEDLLEDVMTEVTQAIDMTNISSSILDNLSDAFASIISNNLNIVMKFMTAITIIMNIPNIVTSFFGMNTKFPDAIANGDNAVAMISILIVAMTLITVWIFYKRDWF